MLVRMNLKTANKPTKLSLLRLGAAVKPDKGTTLLLSNNRDFSVC